MIRTSYQNYGDASINTISIDPSNEQKVYACIFTNVIAVIVLIIMSFYI